MPTKDGKRRFKGYSPFGGGFGSSDEEDLDDFDFASMPGPGTGKGRGGGGGKKKSKGKKGRGKAPPTQATPRSSSKKDAGPRADQGVFPSGMDQLLERVMRVVPPDLMTRALGGDMQAFERMMMVLESKGMGDDVEVSSLKPKRRTYTM